MGVIEDKLRSNDDNDGDEGEHAELVKEKYAAREVHREVKKERDTRQKGVREALTD